MRYIRRMVYRAGLRPKPGNPFYSPSLDITYAYKDYYKKYGESPFLRGLYQGMGDAKVDTAFNEREEDQL